VALAGRRGGAGLRGGAEWRTSTGLRHGVEWTSGAGLRGTCLDEDDAERRGGAESHDNDGRRAAPACGAMLAGGARPSGGAALVRGAVPLSGGAAPNGVSALVGLSLSSAQSGRETKPFLPLNTSFLPTRSGIEVGNQYFFHRQGGKSIFFYCSIPRRLCCHLSLQNEREL
jgi:hypothetical protein